MSERGGAAGGLPDRADGWRRSLMASRPRSPDVIARGTGNLLL